MRIPFAPRRLRGWRALRRLVGLFLLAACFLPLHRLLDPERAGPPAAAVRAWAGPAQSLVLSGTLTLVLVAVLLALLLSADRMQGVLERSRRPLVAPSSLTFGAGLYTLSMGLGLTTILGLHRALPRLYDEMVQLLHARYLVLGEMAAPLPEPAAARIVQNSLLVPEGWTSVYPPGHTTLLALGHLFDAPWVVGPFLLATTVAFTYWALDRLYPERPGTTRLAGILVALSPFLVFIGGGYLSHTSAAAAAAVTLYCAVRAWTEAPAWAVGAGVAAGFGLTARPWMGLVLGGFLTVGIWIPAWWREGQRPRWIVVRSGLAALGALPFVGALLAWNHRLFGSPFQLGYEAAFGPAHGLGFGRDPWGNLYGLREALGYTAADLLSLGQHLFETPVPAVALVAVFLVAAPRLSIPTRILAGWATLPVLANALYWHHGHHLGPRFLFEAAPAWAALTAVAAVGLVEGGRDPGSPGWVEAVFRRRLPAGVALWVTLLSLPAAASLYLVPRIQSYRWDAEGLMRSRPPGVEAVTGGAMGGTEGTGEGRALVFVHGSWNGRVASRLAAAGMRRDSVDTALRRNALCRLHEYAEARVADRLRETLPEVDLQFLPGTPSELRVAHVGGFPVRVDPGQTLGAACVRQLRADRFGGVELAPLLWQTPLPGTGGRMLLFRDLGPDLNQPLLERYQDRTPYLYLPAAADGPPALMPYERGVELLWGEGDAERPPGRRISARPAPAPPGRGPTGGP